MVNGRLRVTLWILGGLAVAWVLSGLAMLPAMGRMMGDGMMLMMGMMAAQVIVMLGMAGVFVYLIVDSARRRRALRQF